MKNNLKKNNQNNRNYQNNKNQIEKEESIKLQKFLAQAGLGSRLKMEDLISQGRVLVNQKTAHLGQRVTSQDKIKVDDKAVFWNSLSKLRVLAYHKVAGELVTRNDPKNRPNIFANLPRLIDSKWQTIGRLDMNTEGLLLVTNSGTFANNLMHPRFGLEREYAVRVLGELSRTEKRQLLNGVILDDGKAQFNNILDAGSSGINVWYHVTISEGRFREVRRMFEKINRAISRLIRIRYGNFYLPRVLKRGTWKELSEIEINNLKEQIKIKPKEIKENKRK